MLRAPRELLNERAGPYRATIHGTGRGYFGRVRPALRITRVTGPNLMDWTDVHFSRAERPATLYRRWACFKQTVTQPNP